MNISETYVCIKFATGYVEEIYQTILKMLQTPNELADALKEIEDMKPEHMNTMLDKQSRAVAIEKHIARKAILPVDVPPTKGTYSFLKHFCSLRKIFPTHFASTIVLSQLLLFVAAIESQDNQKQPRSAPRCRVCKHPVKGHAKIKDCLKNN